MKRKLYRLLKYAVIISVILVFIPVLRKIFTADFERAPPFHNVMPQNPDDRDLVDNLVKNLEKADSRNLYQSGPADSHDIQRHQGDHDKHSNKPPHQSKTEADEKLKRVKKETNTGELKDWHNYKQIEQDLHRTGPGEQGAAYTLSAELERKKSDLFRANGFNALASDQISMTRALKDLRHPQCQKKKYLSKLLKASVVIPFHNEHWSTLLRTAHSVVNRSPPELLHEVILTDDYSNKAFLGTDLEEYVRREFTNVRIVRAMKREGLIRARLLGARAATGDVIIFLDSHCEATTNWLPPLLDPITRDYKTVVCPFIDVINFDNFMYTVQDTGARGSFDWELYYKRLPLLPEDRKHPADPFKSPVMAGGLFAISTKWFWDLGGYDPGLDIWGGEQYEISFKIWQCGGQMLDIPCSHVGHIYRKFAPFPNPGVGDFVGRNYKRVAMVWMDEYAEYIYKRRPHYRNIDAGDLTNEHLLRKKHNCKSFKWFMENIAFDQMKMYPPVEPAPLAEGEIRNGATNLCIDLSHGSSGSLNTKECIKDGRMRRGDQDFEFTFHHDIRPRRRTNCFDVSQSIRKSPVIMFKCHNMKGNQWFKYNLDTKQLMHPVSGQCLDTDKDRHDIYMEPCNEQIPTQRWKFEKINDPTELRKGWKVRLGEE